MSNRRNRGTHTGKKERKATYKVRNWREYNESLVKRYDITVWIKKGWIDMWEEKIPKRKRKQGRQRTYSNLAIECLVTLKYLFRLPYRGLEGFAHSLLLILFHRSVRVPNYSTIQRRHKRLDVGHLTNGQTTREAIDLVCDSTGLKVYGEGEWVVRQHGKSKQRMWRKIHIGINPKNHMIEAVETTENSYDDSELVTPLLAQIEKPRHSYTSDGGYDTRRVYDVLRTRTKRIIIPPRKDARIWVHGNTKGTPHPRDHNLRIIRTRGKDYWKKTTGYHRRSLVEVGIYRLKRILGDTLHHRVLAHQKVEVAIKCRMLNTMTGLGMPESYKVIDTVV